jgi:hypothetical protein
MSCKHLGKVLNAGLIKLGEFEPNDHDLALALCKGWVFSGLVNRVGACRFFQRIKIASLLTFTIQLLHAGDGGVHK